MLQHQIVQSPARLGLTATTTTTTTTNPNSPQQNPSNPPPKIPSSSSSSLLPLVPPLPRAQSLILHMSSLASKLFDVSPNRSVWVSSFRGSLPSFLPSANNNNNNNNNNANAISTGFPVPGCSKEILSLFSTLQRQLLEAVAELQQILDLQDTKNRIARDITLKDSSFLDFASKLKDADRVLDLLVDDYADYKRLKLSDDDDGSVYDHHLGTTVSSTLNLSDILSYAHRISYTTFAPPEFGAGLAPLRGALPPAPQDEQLRASQLYNFADLDVGLPKVVEAKEKTVEAIVEPPPPHPLVPEIPPHLAELIQSKLVVPPGWQPGDPITLPKELLPPPGWKVGDPLPPLESFPPKLLEQHMLQHQQHQQQRQAPPPPVGRPPETIQVRHVQIDILDQDDDSSDYSSEGSSDDED